jgi:hypothetical protein
MRYPSLPQVRTFSTLLSSDDAELLQKFHADAEFGIIARWMKAWTTRILIPSVVVKTYELDMGVSFYISSAAY